MTDLRCPLCGSDKVKLGKETINLSEPYGGEKSFEIDNYVCSVCDFEGDILDQNDFIIIKEANKLKAVACQNIIEHFEQQGISIRAIERILGLHIGSLSEYKTLIAQPDPAVVALLKFLRTYPWLLDVAEAKFSEEKTLQILIDAAQNDPVRDEW